MFALGTKLIDLQQTLVPGACPVLCPCHHPRVPYQEPAELSGARVELPASELATGLLCGQMSCVGRGTHSFQPSAGGLMFYRLSRSWLTFTRPGFLGPFPVVVTRPSQPASGRDAGKKPWFSGSTCSKHLCVNPVDQTTRNLALVHGSKHTSAAAEVLPTQEDLSPASLGGSVWFKSQPLVPSPYLMLCPRTGHTGHPSCLTLLTGWLSPALEPDCHTKSLL